MLDSVAVLEATKLKDPLMGRLPLPLGPLYRRAQNAKTPLDRHLTAFYLWEAALKLLASVAVVEYVEMEERDPKVVERLRSLARPSTGHWWEYVQQLVPILADAQRGSFTEVKEVLFGRGQKDLTRVIALDRALRAALDDKGGAGQTANLSELFQRLVRYRNREIGHGAAGRREDAFYDDMGRALLSGVGEILAHLDVLAGKRLIYVSQVRRQRTGDWLIKRSELAGESARQLESQEWPDLASGQLPRPECVYLATSESLAGDLLPGSLRSLHPLVVYDAERGSLAFLNARRGVRNAEYLCYASGRVHREALRNDQCEFIGRLLGIPVDEQDISKWSDTHVADEAAEGLPRVDDSEPRRTLGEFELVSKIGRGGMGVVWRAWQPSLGRQVAVKSLLRNDDAQAEARFGREIRALARVEHPHLIKVFTCGIEEDEWYYAMELIEGADLATITGELAKADVSTLVEDHWQNAINTAADRVHAAEETVRSDATKKETQSTGGRTATVATSPSPAASMTDRTDRDYIRQVSEIIRQVASAAHALHEAGVVHRDIKPGNIMIIGGTKDAVLTDLGIAQIADEVDGRLTRTRQFVGTLRYASPEQLISAATVDRRTDIYSLGATLWELLTLKPLYGTDENTTTPELMRRIQSQDPERPRKHNQRVPHDLEAVVLKCLERDRDRRYQTAGELAEDLARWQRSEPVRAQPPTLAYVFSKHVRRHKLQIATIAGLVLLAFLGTAMAFVLVNDAKNEAQELAVIEKQLRRQAEYRTAELVFEQSYTTCLDKGSLYGVFSLARSLKAAIDAEHEELERSVRYQLAGWSRSLHRLEAKMQVGPPVFAVSFSPDGEVVASGNASGFVQLWDARDGSAVGETLDCESTVTSLAFSPTKHELLAATDAGKLHLWDINNFRELGEPFGAGNRVNCLAISPDGQLVLAGDGRRVASIYEISTGRTIGQPWTSDAEITAVGFNSDGRFALVGNDLGKIDVLSAQTMRPAREDLQVEGRVLSIVAEQEGDAVYIGSSDGPPTVVEDLQGAAREGSSDPPSSPPDISLIQDRQTHLVADLRPASDRRLLSPGPVLRAPAPPKRSGAMVMSMGISGNGSSYAVAYDNGKVQIRRMDDRSEVGAPLQHTSGVLTLDYSRDGATDLVTGSADGTVCIWDVKPLQHPGIRLNFQKSICTIAKSPNDEALAVGGKGDAVREWTISTQEETRIPIPGAEIVYSLAFSPDGSLLLAGCKDGTARLLNATTGTLVREPLAHGKTVSTVAFSPDGKTIATGCDDFRVRLWDVETGTTKTPPLEHRDEVYAMAFSTNGKKLLTGGKDAQAQVWNVATGKKDRPTFLHGKIIYSVAFLPGEKTIVTGGEDGARIWSVETGEAVGARMHYPEEVRGIAVSPDGAYIVTVGGDATVRLWAATTARAIGQPLRQTDALSSVVLTSDGSTLITGAANGVIELGPALSALAGTPQQIITWAEVITGQEQLPDGSLQPLDPLSWRRKNDELRDLGGLPR